MNHTETFGAGETKDFYDAGDFFRVLDSSSPVTVIFYRNGAEVVKAESINAGYAETFVTGQFDKFKITSPNAQTVQFAARLGNTVQYDKAPVGNVAITNTGGAFVNTQNAVTSASAQLVAANPLRRYLLIQNNDPGGDIWIRSDGGAAAIGGAGSIKIPAGFYREWNGYVPTGAIVAIGSIANNPNIAVEEG